MKSDATKQTAHTMATVRNEARAPMADAAAAGTPVRMAAAVCVFMMVTSSTAADVMIAKPSKASGRPLIRSYILPATGFRMPMAMPLGIITRPDTSALTPRSFCKYAHRVQEQLAGGEGLDEERGDRDHDAVGKHESGGQPLHGAAGHVELVHQRGQGGDHQRLVEDGHKRADHQGDDHGGGVGGGGAVGVGGVVEPASAVAGEELRDVNYQVSFPWLSCLSWLAHTICALTAFENHCND